jgi:hypothetical protein
MFFLGGRGGKRKRQGTVSRVGRWTTCAFKQPFFVYSDHHEAGPRFSFALGRHVRCFRSRQNVDLYHTVKTVKGLLPLVPSRTPRSSGYDVYADVVYVVTCICLLYVVICYMSVICM